MRPPGGTDDPAPDDEINWGDIINVPDIPTSLSDLITGDVADSAIKFLKDPRGWLTGLIIGWITGIWEGILGYVESLWNTLTGIPKVAIYDPIVATFSGPGEAIQTAWESVGTVATDVADVAGPFAPLVIVAVWLIPALLGATVLYAIWGFLETYLPLESIPGLRRLTS